VLVIRNGYICFEDYPNPLFGEDTPHVMYSCTKSVSSALTGIAINEGLYAIDDTVIDFFPGHTFDNMDAWKEAITVQDLLMMRSGIPWDENTYPYGHILNDVTAMVGASDAVQFVLDKPMESEPGTDWNYNTGASHLLSAIITEESGGSTVAFADQHLFGPLGITTRVWATDQQGINWGGHDLYLRPRDMAKFGFLYLNDGTWENQQIVPSTWVATSTSALSTPYTDTGYGYQWWSTPSLGSYSARGYLGQFIFVFEEYDLIIVFTSNNLSATVNYGLLLDYILGSLGEFPLPSPFSNPLLIAGVALAIGIPLGITVIYFIRKRK
jgi:CubicO group peptidase (beta-lactamase class C family)